MRQLKREIENEKNVTDILDIHTHKQEVDTQGKSIINYPLLADSPLYMPLAENVEVAVGRGSYYSIGIHPWEVRESNVSQQLSFLQQQLQRKQFVAVGEAGLDKLAKAPMELQLAVFKEQVKLSEKLGLPLIIHCVKAMEELLGVKKNLAPNNLGYGMAFVETGAGGTVVEERVLSFFWGILSR